jgi:hypothetical protein
MSIKKKLLKEIFEIFIVLYLTLYRIMIVIIKTENFKKLKYDFQIDL